MNGFFEKVNDMLYRLLVFIYASFYFSSQCCAMENLDLFKGELKNTSIRVDQKTSDGVSHEKKVEWAETKQLKNIPIRVDQKISDEVSHEKKIKWVETQSFNIFAADDDPSAALFLKRFFKQPNKINVFVNGEKLVEEFKNPNREFSPTFIIMDGEMPTMDGWQATKILKEKENCPPIFALSGSGPQGEQRFKELNVTAFVHKPIRKATLFSAIYDALYPLTQNQKK